MLVAGFLWQRSYGFAGRPRSFRSGAAAQFTVPRLAIKGAFGVGFADRVVADPALTLSLLRHRGAAEAWAGRKRCPAHASRGQSNKESKGVLEWWHELDG